MESGLSPWLQHLRETEIVQPVQRDQRTGGDAVLGLSADAAKEAAGWGQADFDVPFGNLSPDDRVLLYAYFFQRRHLVELTHAFRQILSNHGLQGEPVVLDLGCGPCTGGLALAAVLRSKTSFEYIGIDRSDAMRKLGARLVSVAARNREVSEIRCHWASEIAGLAWNRPPSWHTVIVIVSYLFASRTLDSKQLADDLNELLQQIGRGDVAILYTNSAKPGPNRKFGAFANRLKQFGFELVTDDTGRIESQRSDRPYELRYALFYRSRQRILERSEEK